MFAMPSFVEIDQEVYYPSHAETRKWTDITKVIGHFLISIFETHLKVINTVWQGIGLLRLCLFSGNLHCVDLSRTEICYKISTLHYIISYITQFIYCITLLVTFSLSPVALQSLKDLGRLTCRRSLVTFFFRGSSP
jgi:hypothetical protein